ncbi:Uncharacterised protein [uncultured archaeon]|nr:Uncharacterised protein [uncultured archaeon]
MTACILTSKADSDSSSRSISDYQRPGQSYSLLLASEDASCFGLADVLPVYVADTKVAQIVLRQVLITRTGKS